MPTNGEFALSDKLFRAACDIARIPPTKRQASKFKLKIGKAYSVIHEAKQKLGEPDGD